MSHGLKNALAKLPHQPEAVDIFWDDLLERLEGGHKKALPPPHDDAAVY